MGGMPSGMEVSLLPSQLTVVPVLLHWQGGGHLTAGRGVVPVADDDLKEPGLVRTAVTDSKVTRHRRPAVVLPVIAALARGQCAGDDGPASVAVSDCQYWKKKKELLWREGGFVFYPIGLSLIHI